MRSAKTVSFAGGDRRYETLIYLDEIVSFPMGETNSSVRILGSMLGPTRGRAGGCLDARLYRISTRRKTCCGRRMGVREHFERNLDMAKSMPIVAAIELSSRSAGGV